MKRAIETFRISLERVRHLGGLHASLQRLTTPVLDSSDLLRAQLVMGVSALDYYVHEVTVLGMVEVFEGKRAPSRAYPKFKVPVGTVAAASNWLEAEVRTQHSLLSFQKPEKIADAIRLFSDVQLWRDVSLALKRPEEDVKGHLQLIVDRRNKIAHEADVDPSFPAQRWPIEPGDVSTSLAFIGETCEAIDKVVV